MPCEEFADSVGVMSSELDAWRARATDAEPDALLRAAELLGPSLAARRSPPLAGGVALPVRTAIESADARSAAIARLLAWAAAAGARWDGIEVRVAADGSAAVLAARSIAPGEPILTLPRHLMIIDDELGLATSDPRDALAAWLPRAARDPASPWRAYLDALPARLAELPMFRDDLDALAGTLAHALATEDARDIRDAYARLAPDGVSLADFAWGCAIVKSRGYHAPGTLEHRIALLPLVDLFNHGLGDTTWTYDPRDGSFVVSTERGFAIGDEVHMSYGDRSNARLLVHFGFTMPGNPADEAALLFDLAADPVNAVAAHLLWQLPLEQPVRACVASSLDHRFRRALSIARLQASGPAERARALEIGLAPTRDLPWLGAAHEVAAFAAMAAAAGRALAALEPAQGGTARDGERAVLEQILELATTVRADLEWQDPARVREAAAGARGLLRQYLHALADELQ